MIARAPPGRSTFHAEARNSASCSLVNIHRSARQAGGVTHYIEADLRDPETILRKAAAILDFDRPVAIMMIAVPHPIEHTARAQEIARTLLDAVPSGSHLAMAHAAHSELMSEGARQWNKVGRPPLVPRHPEEIAAFFEGLDMLEPGLVRALREHPGNLAMWLRYGDRLVEQDDACATPIQLERPPPQPRRPPAAGTIRTLDQRYYGIDNAGVVVTPGVPRRPAPPTSIHSSGTCRVTPRVPPKAPQAIPDVRGCA